ncbi:hypothetical protein ACFX2A_010324 [Malus domestica]
MLLCEAFFFVGPNPSFSLRFSSFFYGTEPETPVLLLIAFFCAFSPLFQYCLCLCKTCTETLMVEAQGRINGLYPGLHGFNIHALGDTSNGCNSTGPHFNPLKNEHEAPSDKERHVSIWVTLLQAQMELLKSLSRTSRFH